VFSQLGAPIADHLSARRGQSSADGGACRVCKRAIAVAQNAQDRNRGVDNAGNLVNVG
jgi:hypothetical protein